MKNVYKWTLAISSTVLCIGSASAGVPNHDQPTTFLGPTIHVGVGSWITDSSAFSLGGDAGLRQFRANANLALKIDQSQRFKLSAEYLWQKITFPYFSGNNDSWMNQGAFGIGYQYDIPYYYNPQFNLTAYLSHGTSKHVHHEAGTFLTGAGLTDAFTVFRRVAGSNADGAAPGVAFQPWLGSRVELDLNYDNVRYDKKFPVREDSHGFGGTFKMTQAVYENVDITGIAAVRQPFNNYSGEIDYKNFNYKGRWTFGAYGEYTAGKFTLQDTWDVGLSATYFIDCLTAAPSNMKGERDLKAEAPMLPFADPFLAWATDPAVHMPVVLAVPDQNVIVTP